MWLWWAELGTRDSGLGRSLGCNLWALAQARYFQWRVEGAGLRRCCESRVPSPESRSSTTTSSPTEFAGHSPNTALAEIHFSATIFASIARASRYSSLACRPTTSSVRIAG